MNRICQFLPLYMRIARRVPAKPDPYSCAGRYGIISLRVGTSSIFTRQTNKKSDSLMHKTHTQETEIVSINEQYPDLLLLERAASLIRQGELVVFPTETVYGLGADAFQPQAVEQIFAVKGRPLSDPLIVHIADEA